MKIYSHDQFLSLLHEAKKPTVFVSLNNPWDNLRVAPIGCFGSYAIMPYVDLPVYPGESFKYNYLLDDTDFFSDYDIEDLFAVLEKDEIKQAIDILLAAIE